MSSINSVPNFGIAWELEVLTLADANGNQESIKASYTSYANESLQIEFDTYQTTSSAFWYADILIYNLNDVTEQLLLKQGQTVRLSAGFQNEQYGQLFEGTLLQPLWERIDGINYKLTLHCVVGLIESTNNFCMINLAAGISQRDIVARIAANARNPINVENINDVPTTSRASRGTVIFGKPSDYFQQIANTNNLNYWVSHVGINIRKLIQSTTNIPTLNYSPATGLIGTPQATQDGVLLSVLLDPRAQIAAQIALSPDTTIKQQPFVQGTFPTILDQNGLYVIGALRHIGSSRGNVWMTQITGYTYAGSKLALFNP